MTSVFTIISLYMHLTGLSLDNLSTAGGFKKIAGKGGWVEYLILNSYLPRGHVKSNVQVKWDINSFRIYDTYFHHDVRGHDAGVTLLRSMRVVLFYYLFFFAIFLQTFPSFFSFSLSSYFPFYCAFISYFCFWPCLFTETSRAFEKRQGQSRFFRTQFFFSFFGI